ncbi:MAG: dipeptidase [Promethearchaeota archaeon]
MKITPSFPIPLFNGHSDYAFFIYHQLLSGNPDHLYDTYYPLMKKSNIGVTVLQVSGDFDLVEFQHNPRDPLVALRTINCLLTQIRRHSQEFHLITDQKTLELCNDPEHTGFILSFEGSTVLGQDLSQLNLFYELGLRSLALTHNYQNQFASGCMEVNGPNELSKLGHKLLKTMEEYPIVLDLVHISRPNFFDALKHYDGVPIVSHSNSDVINPHPRNITDRQIEAIASREGVIGINCIGQFVDSNLKKVTVDRLVDHIEHISKLVGIDHVGLGPDCINYFKFPEPIPYVEGIESVSGLHLIVDRLETRGFSPNEIKKIGFSNFSRVFKKILQ